MLLRLGLGIGLEQKTPGLGLGLGLETCWTRTRVRYILTRTGLRLETCRLDSDRWDSTGLGKLYR